MRKLFDLQIVVPVFESMGGPLGKPMTVLPTASGTVAHMRAASLDVALASLRDSARLHGVAILERAPAKLLTVRPDGSVDAELVGRGVPVGTDYVPSTDVRGWLRVERMLAWVRGDEDRARRCSVALTGHREEVEALLNGWVLPPETGR